MKLDITPELQSRIDAISLRSTLSPSEVITDALVNGRSLEWQERLLDKVAQGVKAADAGEFADKSALDRVRNKYRPA